MIVTFATLAYAFSVPWGIVQYFNGRGVDWLVFAVVGAVFWGSCIKRWREKE